MAVEEAEEWTPLDEIASPRQAAFLAAYVECGFVTKAAKHSGMSKTNHYMWLRSGDPVYREAFEFATVLARFRAVERMEEEADRRAVDGWDEPVFGSGGHLVGTVQVGSKRRYSDGLLMFRLRGEAPEKYAERQLVKQHTTGEIEVKVELSVRERVSADLAALHLRLGTELSRSNGLGVGSADTGVSE